MKGVFAVASAGLLSLSGCLCGPEAVDPDAGTSINAGARDGGAFDAGAPDGGVTDAGSVVDAGLGDAGSVLDAGLGDGGAVVDAGLGDGGAVVDAGPGDGGSMLDAGRLEVVTLAATWVKTVQGSVGGQVLELPDGGLVTVVFIGFLGQPVVLGAGEPHETTFTERAKPAMMWLDVASGSLQHAERVATGPGSVVPQAGVAAGAQGDLYLFGQFHSANTFFPDSSLATPQVGLTQLNGGTLDRAEDPFLVRYAGTSPAGFLRGQTPGPLTTSWFNYGMGLVALPGGDVLVGGHYWLPGFTFGGHALPAGVSQRSYFARIDPVSMTVKWLRANDDLSLSSAMYPGPDGATWLRLRPLPDTTVLADGPNPVALRPVPAPDGGFQPTMDLGRLEADGGFSLVAEFFTPNGQPWDLPLIQPLVWGDALAVYGQVGNGFVMRDAHGHELVRVAAAPDDTAWALRLEADGGVGFLRLFDPGTSVMSPVITRGRLVVPVTASQPVTLDGGLAPIPVPADGGFNTVAYELEPSGRVARVDVLGTNLQLTGVAVGDGGFVFTGFNAGQTGTVRGRDGGTVVLPPSANAIDQLQYVIRFDAP